MNENPSKVIAVRDNIEAAGTITFWRMSGDTDFARLEEAWEEEGLDPDLLPTMPTDTVACRRAVYEQRTPDIIVRPLRRTDEPDGWAIVRETTDTTLRHQPTLHVLPNKIGQLTFETPDGVGVSPSQEGVDNGDARDTAREVANAYDRHLLNLSSNDISKWLVRLVRSLDALGLKDTGGVYFVAKPFVPQWERMVACIRKATPHQVMLIPALRSDEAVDAILSSLQAEAEAEAATMFEEIADGSLGGRALETRADKCAALRRKVEQYETLLGKALPGLTERLTELGSSLTAAHMMAVSDDDAKGVLALPS